ncbi:MAG: DUF6544 family protein [Bacillota bacterium]
MSRAALIIISILVLAVILVIIIPFIATALFNQAVKKEVAEFFKEAKNEDEIIQSSDLEGLPPGVQRWLRSSRVIGKEKIRTVRLKQKASMRLKEEGAWLPAEVEQYFKTDEPGFIWKARVKMAPLLYFTGRDKYYEGRGNMRIKLLSLIKVADARGKEIDQGTLLRYLAETVWFPTAALNSYIKWEEVDASSARATMSYGGITASGVFTFNEKGEVINFAADRYGEFNGQYRLEKWSVQMREHKEFNGIRIPFKGEVVWKLKTGDFSWYQFEIKEIEYNNSAVY